jgi:cytochrome c2
MRKPLLVIGLLAAIVYACNQQDNTLSHLLTTSNLPTQVFSIDITKDTVLHTKNGALIRIPHGALSSGTNPVQLEIKEAYTMQDMLKAGLTTMSNGQPLRSGGMIYINPVGENKIEIKQPLSIATPTPFLDSNMQLFKGNVQPDSTINWVDPKPLGENPQLAALQKGNALFRNICASCHNETKDLTGPALVGVLDRLLPRYNGNIRGLYEFTRNPVPQLLNVPYYRNLRKKYGGVTMTSFPLLTDTDLDNLYAYIDNETKRRYAIPATCEDSCILYRQKVEELYENTLERTSDSLKRIKIEDLPNDTSIFFEDTTTIPDNPSDTIVWEDLQRVIPNYNTTYYYQFSIQSFGWHNIDCMVAGENHVKESQLTVRITGAYKNNFNLYLIIPSVKVMVAGGLLKDRNDEYGFYMNDGAIPLPQQTKAYIIATGEKDKQPIWGKIAFTTQEKQALELKLIKLTKEAFTKEITALKLDNTKIKSAEELINNKKELETAEQLKPKGCDCNSLMLAY